MQQTCVAHIPVATDDLRFDDKKCKCHFLKKKLFGERLKAPRIYERQSRLIIFGFPSDDKHCTVIAQRL